MEEDIMINLQIMKSLQEAQDLLLELDNSSKRLSAAGHINNALAALRTDNRIRKDEQSKIRN